MQRYARVIDGVVAEIIPLPLTQRDLVLNEAGDAVLDAEGAFVYTERPLVPADVFSAEIAAQMVPAPADAQAGWHHDGSTWAPPPPPEPPPPMPIVISAERFLDRTTKDEADAINAAMAERGFKISRSWALATRFEEGTDLWTALAETLAGLFEAERAAELLAP